MVSQVIDLVDTLPAENQYEHFKTQLHSPALGLREIRSAVEDEAYGAENRASFFTQCWSFARLGWRNTSPSTTSSCRDFPRPIGRSWERFSLPGDTRILAARADKLCFCALNVEKRHRRRGRARGGCTSQGHSHQGRYQRGRYQRARWKEPWARRCQGWTKVAASSGHHSHRIRRPRRQPYSFPPCQGLFRTLPLPLGVCGQGGQEYHPLLLGKLGRRGCLNAVIPSSLVHLVDQLSNRHFW